METLKEMVLALDPGALALARQAGAGAAAALRELAGRPEAPVRVLALQVLLEAGGTAAVEACLSAALDDHPQVRAVAVRGLAALLDPARAPALLDLYDRCPDPETRRQLALAYGKMDKADAAALKKRQEKEREPEALEGLVAAAARLGDKDAQAEFARRLQAASSPEARARFLEYAELIGAPWVLKALLPLLDDATPVARVGADGRGEVPEYLKARDAAVNLATAIAKRKSPFKVDAGTSYGEPEVEDVRRFLKGLA